MNKITIMAAIYVFNVTGIEATGTNVFIAHISVNGNSANNTIAKNKMTLAHIILFILICFIYLIEL